jgi:hypothetical protein
MENVIYNFLFLWGIRPISHDFSGNFLSCTRNNINCVNELNLINLEWPGLSLVARIRGIICSYFCNDELNCFRLLMFLPMKCENLSLRLFHFDHHTWILIFHVCRKHFWYRINLNAEFCMRFPGQGSKMRGNNLGHMNRNRLHVNRH